jgi:hypothetical protein
LRRVAIGSDFFCVEVMSSVASEKWENRGNKLAGGVSGDRGVSAGV